MPLPLRRNLLTYLLHVQSKTRLIVETSWQWQLSLQRFCSRVPSSIISSKLRSQCCPDFWKPSIESSSVLNVASHVFFFPPAFFFLAVSGRHLGIFGNMLIWSPYCMAKPYKTTHFDSIKEKRAIPTSSPDLTVRDCVWEENVKYISWRHLWWNPSKFHASPGFRDQIYTPMKKNRENNGFVKLELCAWREFSNHPKWVL